MKYRTRPRSPGGTLLNIVEEVRGIVGAIREIPGRIQAQRIEEDLTADLIPPDAFDRYRREIDDSGLLDDLAQKRRWYFDNVDGRTRRGDTYVYGGMDDLAARNLYALLRARRPRTVVETGVCNGHSTAIVLYALHRNGMGHLHSIDLPETAEGTTEPGTFWEGKGGAAVPSGKEPGWVIPDELRDRWSLTLGSSQDELAPLLDELGTIDAFLHDSEHSYECMSFEMESAYPHLGDEGLLIVDDATWNQAFSDFAAHVEHRARWLSPKVGLMVQRHAR